MSLAAATTLDLRSIAPVERHPMIFSTFFSLGAGEAMEIVNDHDPQPLRRQFETQWPGQYTWTALEAGPQTWRIAITRSAAPRGACCGACGGA